MNRKTKQKRRPNSATSGGRALGRISCRMSHQIRSPLNRAASTNSITVISMATALDRRKTRVESNSAITTIRDIVPVPTTESTIRAKIRVGKAIRMSTIRLMLKSVHPPRVAAKNPKMEPTTNDSMVVTKAMAMVLRAP